jgi:hypothetical protein
MRKVKKKVNGTALLLPEFPGDTRRQAALTYVSIGRVYILDALHALPHPKADKIVDPLREFLNDQWHRTYI